MKINDLQIGQNITALYWFHERNGCDCCEITGVVAEKLTETAAIDVTSSTPGWYSGRRIWVDRKTEILSINN